MAKQIASERLYLTADGEVTTNPAGAATLLCPAGGVIPDGYEAPKAKQSKPASNKQAKAPANKAAVED